MFLGKTKLICLYHNVFSLVLSSSSILYTINKDISNAKVKHNKSKILTWSYATK